MKQMIPFSYRNPDTDEENFDCENRINYKIQPKMPVNEPRNKVDKEIGEELTRNKTTRNYLSYLKACGVTVTIIYVTLAVMHQGL